jgi:CheY-like chemotaxis protein
VSCLSRELRIEPVLDIPQPAPIFAWSTSTPRTAIVVDDDPKSLLFSCRILEKCGWAVLRADEPSRAIELFEEYGLLIDVLVTDFQMPGMNGCELAASFRGRRPDLPVLCMSGGRPFTGEFRLIEKPFTSGQLIECVAAVLCSSRAGKPFLSTAFADFQGEKN